MVILLSQETSASQQRQENATVGPHTRAMEVYVLQPTPGLLALSQRPGR